MRAGRGSRAEEGRKGGGGGWRAPCEAEGSAALRGAAMVVLRRSAGSRRRSLAAMDSSSEFLSLQPGGRRTSRQRAAPAVSSRGVPSERARAGSFGGGFVHQPPTPSGGPAGRCTRGVLRGLGEQG